MALRSSAGTAQPQPGRTVTLDPALPRKAAAELLGTALLVFFGCGVATVTFGFRAVGSSYAAGVVASSLAFGIVIPLFRLSLRRAASEAEAKVRAFDTRLLTVAERPRRVLRQVLHVRAAP